MANGVTRSDPSDVFIAHAGEDKNAVARPLAEALIAEGWNVWLDELRLKLGDSLSQHIDSALANTRFGIVILSPNFFAKEWPQRELAGLAAREISNGTKVILPVWHEVDHNFIVDRSPLLADRLGALTGAGIEKVADEISSVLADKPARAQADRIDNALPVSQVTNASLFEIPSTPGQQEKLLEDCPDWWEYRLYAGVLMQGRIRLEDKWQDHQLRLSRGDRRDIDEASFGEAMSRELGWMRRQVSAMDRVFDPGTTEKAFGPKGEPGDSLLVRRIAEGVIGVYEALMDWAANLRAMSVDNDYEEIVELTARMADGPIEQIREFIQLVADKIARIPTLEEEAADMGATEESPSTLTLTLSLAVDEDVQSELHSAIDRAS